MDELSKQTLSDENKEKITQKQCEKVQQGCIDTEQKEVRIEQAKEQQPENEKFLEQNLELAENLKAIGTQHFKKQQFFEAIGKYQQALKYLSNDEKKLRSIIYSNISICLSKQNNYKQSISYCKKAIQFDETYLKAYMNLAIAYEKTDNPQEALTQYKKIVQLNPNDIKMKIKVVELEKSVAELNQKRKTEVLDGLKNIGNSILGYFGMSLDNFKLEQGNNGGYNVSFKN